MGHKEFPFAVVIEGIDRVSAPLAKVGGSIQRFGDKAAKISQFAMLAITAPVAALFTESTLKSLSTERAMMRLGDATQATAEQLHAAAKATEEMAGGFDKAQRLDALTAMSQQVGNLADALGALPATTNLAIAAEADLGETSKLTLKVLRAYGLEIGQVTHVTDLLASANAASDLGWQGVADSLISVSPLAHSLGLGIDDIAASIVHLGKVSANPVSVLRTSISKLLKPTKEGAKALAALSISRPDVFKSNGNLRSLSDIIGVLEKHGATATDMLKIFGMKAGPGLTALLNQGHASLERTAERLGKTGAAAEMAGKRSNSADGAFKRLRHSWEDLQDAIGESGVTDEVSRLANALSRMARSMAKASPERLKLVVDLLAIAAAVGPLSWLAVKVATGFGYFARSAAWLGRALVPVAAALGLPLELVAALALALPLMVIYWDDWTGALTRWVKQTDSVREALNWINENLFFGAKDIFGKENSAVVKQRFDSAMPLGGTTAHQVRPVLGSEALKRAWGAGSVGGAGGEVEVNVNFKNAPPGTQATVERVRGARVGLDMGYSMQHH